MKFIITLLFVFTGLSGISQNPLTHVYVDADNTLCHTESLKMNVNLMRALSFFGISVVDMITRMDYRGMPGTKTCFRQLIKEELENAVPSVKFGSIYTPHDEAIARTVPEWQMGMMYKHFMAPIEKEFLKLLRSEEFLFTSQPNAMALRSELYRKYRLKDAPKDWKISTQDTHARLNNCLRRNKLFYEEFPPEGYSPIDWGNAHKGHVMSRLMYEEIAKHPHPKNHFVIFIDDWVKERDDVSRSLRASNIPHLVMVPPYMRDAFLGNSIYMPIGMFIFELAVNLKRLPHFGDDDFAIVLDMAEQDSEQKYYQSAMFLLGLLHRSFPNSSAIIEEKILEVLPFDPNPSSIFEQEAFKEIDILSENIVEYSSAKNHWVYLTDIFNYQIQIHKLSTPPSEQPEKKGIEVKKNTSFLQKIGRWVGLSSKES